VNDTGGNGGNSFGRDPEIGATGRSGVGGYAQGGNASGGGVSGDGQGAGIFNAGSATFNGVTLNITANRAAGGIGSYPGTGGKAFGGNGGAGPLGAAGGNATGGNSGSNAHSAAGNAFGGGLFNSGGAMLVISPRRGAAKDSAQSGATDSISQNQSIVYRGGNALFGGTAVGGAASPPNTTTGTATPGQTSTGTPVAPSGMGGGLYLDPGGTAFLSNAVIQGNQASTSDNDVDGTFMPAP
jgi:hypothetical protein